MMSCAVCHLESRLCHDSTIGEQTKDHSSRTVAKLRPISAFQIVHTSLVSKLHLWWPPVSRAQPSWAWSLETLQLHPPYPKRRLAISKSHQDTFTVFQVHQEDQIALSTQSPLGLDMYGGPFQALASLGVTVILRRPMPMGMELMKHKPSMLTLLNATGIRPQLIISWADQKIHAHLLKVLFPGHSGQPPSLNMTMQSRHYSSARSADTPHVG